MFLDVNPNRKVMDGWVSHIINDGAAMKSPFSSNNGNEIEQSMLEYYQESKAMQNCIHIPLMMMMLLPCTGEYVFPFFSVQPLLVLVSNINIHGIHIYIYSSPVLQSWYFGNLPIGSKYVVNLCDRKGKIIIMID
jgi:hypothetical protein